MIKALTAMAAACALVLAAGGCKKGGGSGKDTIPIGFFGAMTGQQATFGTSDQEGVDLAVEQINAAGGVLGKKINIISGDDQSNPTQAATVVEKLINRDQVVALIGEVASSNSLAAAPIAQQAKIPMLSPASTNVGVTQVGDYIFRACFIDPFQGSVMAKFAVNDLHKKNFAVLYDVNSDYSKGLRDAFVKAAKELGGRIVETSAYSQTDSDFKAQLTKIKNANPDAIYVPGYYTQVGQIVRQARDLGITVPLMGGDGWDSEQTFAIAGPGVAGCYFTNHYSPDEKRPAVGKFVEAYKKKYNGKTPDAMAILGYDAMRLMADAIKRAGSTDPKAIRDALAATKDFPGASGNITMDKNRNAQKPIVILKTTATGTEFVKSIEGR
jgi:branched-chain amino acid transport system substrate-binding protein